MGASAGENAGQVDLSSVFADAVVMGDSQAEAFEAYGILPSQSVAATIGRSIITAEEDYNKTVSRTPKQVFITYGMNDCLIYNGNTEKFISVYSDLITRLQTDMPDVQVFVCSIIVPSDAAVQKKPALAAVTDYNAALQQLAAEKGLVYIDAGALIQPDVHDVRTGFICKRVFISPGLIHYGMVCGSSVIGRTLERLNGEKSRK